MTMLGRAIAGVEVGRVVDDVLGLPLGLLVRVAELLARVELALAERALVTAGDVRGRDVDEALQAPERLASRAKPIISRVPSTLICARLVERQVERDRGRAVHHRADLLGERACARRVHARGRARDVAGDRARAVAVRRRVAPELGQHAVEPLLRPRRRRPRARARAPRGRPSRAGARAPPCRGSRWRRSGRRAASRLDLLGAPARAACPSRGSRRRRG